MKILLQKWSCEVWSWLDVGHDRRSSRIRSYTTLWESIYKHYRQTISRRTRTSVRTLFCKELSHSLSEISHKQHATVCRSVSISWFHLVSAPAQPVTDDVSEPATVGLDDVDGFARCLHVAQRFFFLKPRDSFTVNRFQDDDTILAT